MNIIMCFRRPEARFPCPVAHLYPPEVDVRCIRAALFLSRISIPQSAHLRASRILPPHKKGSPLVPRRVALSHKEVSPLALRTSRPVSSLGQGKTIQDVSDNDLLLAERKTGALLAEGSDILDDEDMLAAEQTSSPVTAPSNTVCSAFRFV